jgi:catechol 2,3-dioxygenase-like lactoylglutathione lyase family enzyme
MKRFHVHVVVADLEQNIRFYSTVFGTAPTVVKDDYAKWMLDEPRVNFAISSRGAQPGVDHLGFQVDSDEELDGLRAQVAQADIATLDQPAAACCYARSDKYWTTDPQGIAWETFRTLGDIPRFGETAAPAAAGEPPAACCAPPAQIVGFVRGQAGGAIAVESQVVKSSCC